MKKIILLILIIASGNLFAQNHHLYDLGKLLRHGDLNALHEIGDYFDSKKEITEYLGYHIISTSESNVAKRLVQENSMFLDSEIIIDASTTKNKFKKFLSNNKISFSKLAEAFIITPFDKRKTDFEITALTEFKWNLLNSQRTELMELDWVKKSGIDTLINSENPLVLLEISSILLKSRSRFDEYQYNQEEMINLIKLLTMSQIAVPNNDKELSYHIEKDFYGQSKINLLVFFANNYQDYTWDISLNVFKNNRLRIKPIDIETNLFEKLSSENDSISINTFIDLTKMNPKRVTTLADQYRKSDISTNYILPTFPYRFLKQLVSLTDYCNQKKIDFEGSEKLKNKVQLLKTELTFKTRRKLENELIFFLTLDNITAFEYWALVYETSWGLTYSAGRILDIFYSKNWQKLINSPAYLEIYLLKSRLFHDLGIIGFCNNYLVKFIGSSKHAISLIENLSSTHLKVQGQLEKVKKIAKTSIRFKEKEKKTWYGNTPKDIKNFKKSYFEIFEKQNDITKQKTEVSFLLSQINYSQIGEALLSIEDLSIEPYYKYSFIANDFGFFDTDNFEESKTRQIFIESYQKLNELEFYKHYLSQKGIDFTNPNRQLDFDKIYKILKYDINTAFIGGGGSPEDNGVYLIIKTLELTFKTTFGYPNKLCCSNNTYACNSRSRAEEWMNYLKVNKHLKKEHNEPVSFAYK